MLKAWRGDMEAEQADVAAVVAIMAAIIYAGRTGESEQAPNEKAFGVVAKAAWDLHRAVVGYDARAGRAGQREQPREQ